MLLLGAGLVVLLVASAGAVIMLSSDDETPDAPDQSPSPLDDQLDQGPARWRVAGQVEIPYGSIDVAAVGDSAWVTNGNELYRVDRSSLEVADSVEMIGAAYNVAASPPSVWVVNDRPYEEVIVVDASTTGKSEAEYIPLPNDVDLEGDDAWVLGLSSCGRLDAATARITLECDLGGEAIDATDDAVWIVGDGLAQVDPQTGEVVDGITLPGRGTAVASTRDAVWVVVDTRTSTELLRIDPTDLSITDVVDVGSSPADGYPQGLAATETDVWATNSVDGTLVHVDPETVEITQTLDVGTQPRGIAVIDDEIWVADGWTGTDGDTGAVYVVAPEGSS